MILNILNFLYVFNTSVDVIHAICIPGLKLKIDSIPGKNNCLYIYSNFIGIFRGQCSELCGSLHGFMPIKFKLHIFSVDFSPSIFISF